MIHNDDYYKAKKSLPREISDIIKLGHRSLKTFSNLELEELKIQGKLLLEELFLYEYTKEGEEVWKPHGLSVGSLGPLYVIISQSWYLLPRHFMSPEEIYNFIMECIQEHHPELLI